MRRAKRPPRVIAFGCVENNHPPASWKVCDIIQRSIARSRAGSAARPIFFWFVSVCPVWLRSGQAPSRDQRGATKNCNGGELASRLRSLRCAQPSAARQIRSDEPCGKQKLTNSENVRVPNGALVSL